jgi:hypothetical protein
MGARRSDQIPSNPPATDFKTRTDDEHIIEEDKQALNARPRSDDKLPTGGENPALTDLKRRLNEADSD